MIEFVKVRQVRPLDGSRLWIEFSNGSTGIRDCSDILNEGGLMVEPLRDPETFARAFVQCGVVAWPKGFDIDSIELHREMKAAGSLTETKAAIEAQAIR